MYSFYIHLVFIKTSLPSPNLGAASIISADLHKGARGVGITVISLSPNFIFPDNSCRSITCLSLKASFKLFTIEQHILVSFDNISFQYWVGYLNIISLIAFFVAFTFIVSSIKCGGKFIISQNLRQNFYSRAPNAK